MRLYGEIIPDRHTNHALSLTCTTIRRYTIFSTRYSVMCKGHYCGTSEIEHGFCACTVDNPLAKARGLSLRTGAQTMLSHITAPLFPPLPPRLTLPVSAEAVFDLQSNSSSRTSFIVCKGIKVFNSIETIGRIFGKEVSDPL